MLKLIFAFAIFFVPLQAVSAPRTQPVGNIGGLVTVPTAAGVTVTVAASFAPRIEAFIAALVERGYRPAHVGCFARGGHVRHSLHYSGLACDFDQRGWGRTAAPMRRLGGLAAAYGLRDGCSFGDCGHVDAGEPITRRSRSAGLRGGRHSCPARSPAGWV